MAVPLDEQFKIEKKGIIEKRIPVLVTFKNIIYCILYSRFLI
jgi:hypothetical protein